MLLVSLVFVVATPQRSGRIWGEFLVQRISCVILRSTRALSLVTSPLHTSYRASTFGTRSSTAASPVSRLLEAYDARELRVEGLSYIGCALNPICYCVANSKFRRAMMITFGCDRPRGAHFQRVYAPTNNSTAGPSVDDSNCTLSLRYVCASTAVGRPTLNARLAFD